MQIVNNISDVRKIIKQWQREGLSVGFVPTMGYLHEGHASLIEAANKENAKVVVSIFVNPIQFGPKEDLDKYPRDLERDSKIVETSGGDLIFNPSPSEMYTEDFSSFVEVNSLTDGLCGAKRPGHFKGVCTVVTKLFNIVTPDKAYFGEKDAQQLAVIKKMVRDLNIPVEIIGCPIIRENDGLAKSSRNVYLNSEERAAALVLSKSLEKAKEALKSGERSSEKIRDIIMGTLSSEPLAQIDYVEIVDSISLTSIDYIENSILIAIAVFIGKTRLIDNFTFKL
ncbi:pantoate--beta-alanine ligase [Clostridium fungisolvens]|uniref:Pantothenate synthetase n=1 Tax=Clostridium fungisolvens TaxID=1604897 RepID=A0A6V8SH89_9CLOT|nr:pantoate--beta-alanine ligase [Clostridium fungisolvens]GFP76086.1 Pantothenate synthetase [Clostridium fungisolvens]